MSIGELYGMRKAEIDYAIDLAVYRAIEKLGAEKVALLYRRDVRS